VYGYKQSFGRVPYTGRPNAFNSTFPFIFEGAITRTVEDAALALNALAGYDARDPFSLEDGQKPDFTRAMGRSLEGWRIAYSPNLDVFPVDGRVAEAVADAVTAFEEAGAGVEEVELGIQRDQRELSDLWCRQIMVINVEAFENFKLQGLDLLKDHRHDFPPEYLEWIERCYEMGVRDLVRDLQMRTEVYDATQKVFENHDLLVSPTLACLPVHNADDGNTVGPSEINGIEVDPLIGWCLTYFANFTGHPAASVPAGLAEDRLPVGMQILGRRYADADVLAASAAFERMRPWHQTYGLCRNRPV
jgi:amidase/aspartyl-tRNA(Asn)/glutamyl-tRNA(Gln) amidotransferase subunit A